MRKCNHCQNSFSLDALQKCIDEGKELYFCCNGCKSVYFLLKENHIQAFYEKLQDSTLSPPIGNISNYDYYDSPNFQEKYTQSISQTQSSITLLIHDIHCSACIWLNELMLNKLEGVLEAQINYTNHQATITWNPHSIKLSKIIQTIYSLGYKVSVGEQMEQKAKEEKRLFFTKLIVAIFCTMNIMWIAIAQYSGYFQGITQEYSLLLNSASFLLCTPVLFFSGSVFYISAYKGLKLKRVGMDLLVFSGSLITYLYSIYASLIGYESYFESVSMILTFVLLGKFLENKAKENAGEILQSLSLHIPQSLRVKDKFLPPQAVEIGSEIEVFAGEKIIIDGILLSSHALIDESSLSGESKPIAKKRGEPLFSGSLNLSHNISYQSTHSFEQSTLNTLIELVKKAQYSKPQIQKIANAISSRFSQIVLFLACCTFGIDLFYLHLPFDEALKIAVSIIIIACPCALALATPIANISGLSSAYTQGIIFKQGISLEALSKVDTICFDKTGTLTQGKPTIIKEIKFEPYDPLVLSAFLSQDLHPIAKGILEGLPPSKIPITSFEMIASEGIKAQSPHGELLGGRLDFLSQHKISIPPLCAQEGSIFAFAQDGILRSIFYLQDPLKPHAKEVIQKLQKKQLLILSGDEENEVSRIAHELEIPIFYAKQSPTQKAQIIQDLQKQGKKVAMIGDGINDSLALQYAEVSITMADKSDLALQSSDIILLQDKLTGILKATHIADKTYATIKQNLLFSLFYNALTIPLAILGYISPIFAALSMSASSLVVVLNSLRIKNYQPKLKNNAEKKSI